MIGDDIIGGKGVHNKTSFYIRFRLIGPRDDVTGTPCGAMVNNGVCGSMWRRRAGGGDPVHAKPRSFFKSQMLIENTAG